MPNTLLPPAGPAWAGSLMGTSIAATLTRTHGLPVISDVFLLAATGILAVLVVGWLRHRNPRFTQEFMGPWGMVSMGLLALGGAWAGATGNWSFQIAVFILATPLAVVACLWQLRRFAGAPTFLWGLGLVSPMVSATSGGQIHQAGILPDDWSTVVWVIAVACFVLSLVTGVPLFALLYRATARGRTRIPAGLADTTWIPLGIVGQSTAAAQLLTLGGAWDRVGVIYGCVMFALGVPMVIFAAARFWPAVARWADYTPGWWGSTFPTGTLSLGSHLLAESTGLALWDVVSRGFLALLLLHWTASAARAGGHALGVWRFRTA